MIKNIMVCTDGSTYGDVACQYAIYLTTRLGARLIGLHVLDSRMLEGPMMADISNWVGAQPYGAQLQNFTELMQDKGESVIDAFETRCREAGMTAETALRSGHPVRVILEEEARSELLVLGKRGEHARWLEAMIGSSVERIVRRSVKPCLVTPERFKPVSRILIAFDGSTHGSGALREGVEMSQAIQAPVTMLTVGDDQDPEKARKVSEEGLTMARAHGCSVEALVREGEPSEVILSVAQSKACDLIVMGAYGHPRIREMILGSNTNHVLMHAEVPVMLVR